MIRCPTDESACDLVSKLGLRSAAGYIATMTMPWSWRYAVVNGAAKKMESWRFQTSITTSVHALASLAS